VRGFTEALREEMLINGHPVHVTCVHPGGIKTAIARNAGAVEGEDAAALAEFFDSKLAKTTPEAAAKTILRAVVGNRPRAVVGLDAKLLDLLVRVTGPGYQRLVAFSASRVKPKSLATVVPAEPGVLAGEGPSASHNGATKASA
jgi:short-subunit dehydrogenase